MGTIQPVDAVDDQWLGLGEAFGQRPGEKQVLGGAGAATLAQHPLYAAVARPAIGSARTASTNWTSDESREKSVSIGSG